MEGGPEARCGEPEPRPSPRSPRRPAPPPRAGEGRFAYTDRSVYEGAWRYNSRHGKGVYHYANGDRHVGMWFTGKKHGKGKYTSASANSRFSGVWKDGELVKGSVRAPDGSFFTSAFSKGQPAGPAAFCLANGALVEGLHPDVAAKDGDEEADDEGKKGEEDAEGGGGGGGWGWGMGALHPPPNEDILPPNAAPQKNFQQFQNNARLELQKRENSKISGAPLQPRRVAPQTPQL